MGAERNVTRFQVESEYLAVEFGSRARLEK